MHLKDLLQSEISDFQQERIRLQTFFEGYTFYTISGKCTLKKYLSDAFLSTQIRGTHTDIDDLLRTSSRFWDNSGLDGLLFYCEVIAGIIYSCSEYIEVWDPTALQLKKQCIQNINIILDKTGYKVSTDYNGIVTIIKKDALASCVIEDIDDKATAKAILEYNWLDIKGKLEEKQKLLKQIGNFIEPILQKKRELPCPLHDLADDISFCLNNLNLRHNNKEGNYKNEVLGTMSSKDFENLYDDTYRMMLLLIEFSRQQETHEQLNKLRKQSKGQ